MIIRKANHNDTDQLISLLSQSWFIIHAPFVSTANLIASFSSGVVPRHVSSSIEDTYLAELDGGILGAISTGFGIVSGLAVKSSCWKRGIGSALLTIAEQDGCDMLEVAVYNTRAVALYQRHGWEICTGSSEETVGSARIPCWIMEKAPKSESKRQSVHPSYLQLH